MRHAVAQMSYTKRIVNGEKPKVKDRGTIANVLNDSTVMFLLFQPENVSVELDGDITSSLLIFASKSPVTTEEAQRQKRRFV